MITLGPFTISLDTICGFVLAFVLANVALKLTVILWWYRVEKPQIPLLKPVTLCAAVSACRRAVLFWRSAQSLCISDIRRDFGNRGRVDSLVTQERIQEYV
jgi:hypothetical protein